MFMVKDEFANIKKLLSVRLKFQDRSYIGLLIGLAIFLVISLGSTVIGILRNSDGFRHFIVTDFSGWFFFGMVIGFVISMFMYRHNNAPLSVFPQTNNSRFVSSMIANCIAAVVVALIALVNYLLNLGAINILSAFRDNIRLALTVDAGFIVAGFFVYLAYIFIIIAVCELVGAILRKWTYYAAGVFIVLAALMIANLSRVIELVPRALAFLIREPSLTLFFVKAFGVWLVITAAAFIINRFTIYGKSQNQFSTKGVVIVLVVAAVLLAVVIPLSISLSSPPDGSYWVSEVSAVHDDDFFTGSGRTRIDVSHFPRGSRINISGTNIFMPDEGGSWSSSNPFNDAVVLGAETLNDLQGDTIVVEFFPTEYIVNGIEMSQYANQRVTAYLDGDTLFLDFTSDSASVVIMPIWGIVRQFDYFRDKGVLQPHAFGFSSGWWGSTQIFIYVE